MLNRRTFLGGVTAAAALGCGPRDTPFEAVTSRRQQVAMRQVEQTIRGMATSDGAGVNLTRVIGQPILRNLDPFLMLDELRSDDPGAYIAGFPDHPHRGFETVSIMLDGKMRHRDSRGNQGLIEGGGIQWMTAGRGIVHSEIPEQDRGMLWGFQLWINLPAAEKMTEPFYQDMQASTIANVALSPRSRLRIMSGEFDGQRGPIRQRPSEPILVDVKLSGGENVEYPTPLGHRAFAYVYRGRAKVGDQSVEERSLTILSPGDRVRFEAETPEAGILFAAGKPFGEPIVQHGPFVMNTQEEIQRAFYDYQRGTLGRD